jgi:hypothetical protein
MKARLVAIAFLLPLTLAACSSSRGSPGAGDEPVGEATAAITVVPANVACVDIDVVQAADDRVVNQTFTVTPGQGAVLTLKGLPLGAVTFSGLAYPVACSAVTSTTAATWATDPVPATIVAGQTTTVAMDFSAAGSAAIGVNFADAGAWPITIAESSVTFPATACGTAPAAQTVSITNVSSASVTVTGAITDSAPIALSPTSLTLAAGKTGTMSLVASPSAKPGTVAGTLTLDTNITGDSPHLVPISEDFTGDTFTFVSASGAAEPTLSWGSTVQGTGSETTTIEGTGTSTTVTGVTVVVTPGASNLPGATLLINGAAATSWRGTAGSNPVTYTLDPPANTPCGTIFTYTVTIPTTTPGVCGGSTQTLTILEGNTC